MMYEEFCKLAGYNVDMNMYNQEIEPTYMAFDSISKEELAAMYTGAKKGAYELWHRGKTLAKELNVINDACDNLRKIGIIQNANDLISFWNARAKQYVADVKEMKLVK